MLFVVAVVSWLIALVCYLQYSQMKERLDDHLADIDEFWKRAMEETRGQVKEYQAVPHNRSYCRHCHSYHRLGY
jgi:hypothetical protein